jgi:hypothetical protein
MAHEIKLPFLGYPTQRTITRWLKRLGEPVKRGDPLFEIGVETWDPLTQSRVDTQKSQIHSMFDGVLSEIRVAAGHSLEVNAVAAVLSGPEEIAALRAMAENFGLIEPPTPTPARMVDRGQHEHGAADRLPVERPQAPNTSSTPSTEGSKQQDEPKVFLCYRREDTQDAAGRLHDRLVDTYGRGSIFMDIDSVPLGTDFVDYVSKEIGRCRAVIVMIGRQWLKIRDRRRRRRLDNPDDLVRAEIAAALRQNIPVIPVLVQDAEMPFGEELPEDIRPLVRRNGIALSHTRWRTDVERLMKELDRAARHESG